MHVPFGGWITSEGARYTNQKEDAGHADSDDGDDASTQHQSIKRGARDGSDVTSERRCALDGGTGAMPLEKEIFSLENY